MSVAALPPKGWSVQFLDAAGDVQSATSDLLSLSVERRLSEAGQIELHVPRTADLARSLAPGVRFRVLYGDAPYAAGVVTDVVGTSASIRLVGATAEVLLSMLYLPPDVYPIGGWGSRGLGSLLQDMLHGWHVEVFGLQRWAECTLTGGEHNNLYVYQTSTSSLTIETPWVDIGEPGWILDHICLVRGQIPGTGLTGTISYATAASPGTPSWVATNKWLTVHQEPVPESTGRSVRFDYVWVDPTKPTLDRYLKVRVALSATSDPQLRIYKLHAGLRSPWRLLSPGSPWPPDTTVVRYYFALQEQTGRTVRDWMREYVPATRYEITVTPDWALNVYDLDAGQYAGADRRNEVVLVWGESIAPSEWARATLEAVTNNGYVVGEVLADEDSYARRAPFDRLLLSAADARANLRRHGMRPATLEGKREELHRLTSLAAQAVQALAPDLWEITAEVVPPARAAALNPGDIISIVIPERQERLDARVAATVVRVGPGGETWSVVLLTGGTGPTGGLDAPQLVAELRRRQAMAGGLAHQMLRAAR